jgi:hypothetical protein
VTNSAMVPVRLVVHSFHPARGGPGTGLAVSIANFPTRSQRLAKVQGAAPNSRAELQ